MMLKSVVKQYLDRYAESETHQLKGFHSRPFKNCIVIPCFNETPHFFQRLCKSALAEETLVIVVINQPAATSVSSQNIQLAEFLQQSRLLWRRDNLSLLESQHCGAWLLVDRFTQNQIPPKQGVGLARKIGCDLAVKLKQQGFIASNWIHCTDADAHLPDNYFDIPGQGSAAVFNFTHFQAPHTYDPAVEEATQCYERAIKYYVAGLRWAGSPYAFNTVGSALAVEHQAYCQVRGFPKKAGGEDFYLLNKLAKLGPVIEAKHITVRLESRLSQRTPFGTGQSVAQILTDKDRPAPTLVYYHPQTFTHLKAWLNQAPQLWQNGNIQQNQYEGLSDDVKNALTHLKIQELFTHIDKQINTYDQYQKALHDWFDGFRTLKFIRYFNRSIPNIPIDECIRQSPFTQDLATANKENTATLYANPSI